MIICSLNDYKHLLLSVEALLCHPIVELLMVEYFKLGYHQLVSVRPRFLLFGSPLLGQTLSHLLGILEFGHFIILLGL